MQLGLLHETQTSEFLNNSEVCVWARGGEENRQVNLIKKHYLIEQLNPLKSGAGTLLLEAYRDSRSS